ncbi:MAG: hypothetical protein HC866_23925 [Leptolyngbyaceae cyanobacterium RU_5_1]|nr:hypothetical protein [Leptolyngbyaceae cyanobacterium RU_5_1]
MREFAVLETAAIAMMVTDATTETPRSLSERLATLKVPPKSAGTPLSWQAIAIWTQPEPIDLYFQPAITRSNGGINGIALLFIENAMPEVGTPPTAFAAVAAETDNPDDRKDFSRLSAGLLAWAIYAYYVPPIEPGRTITDADRTITINTQPIQLADLEDLYEKFVNRHDDPRARFNFANLTAFLKQNFSFNIANRSSDVSASIFPMFPQLSMQFNDTSTTERFFDSHQLSIDDQAYLNEYFQRLKVSHGSTAEPIAPLSGPTEPESVAALIFTDYFALLIRASIQSAIDYVKDNPGQIHLPDLLDALHTNGTFSHLAGAASRFLLHGLRLPTRNSTLSTPLYERTQQQFEVLAIAETPIADAAIADFKITLKRPDSLIQERVWVKFNNDAALKTWDNLLPATQIRQFKNLNQPENQLPSPIPELLPFYTNEPRRFNLRQHTQWQSTLQSAPALLLELPDALQNYLYTKGDAGVRLTLNYGESSGDRTELKPDDIRRLTNYTWATTVKVTVRRVPEPNSTDFLKTTYVLVGTNEADKNLLEEVWSHRRTSSTPPRLYLLYGSDSDGLTNQIPRECVLLKTNLSTESNAPPTAMMMAMDAIAPVNRIANSTTPPYPKQST